MSGVFYVYGLRLKGNREVRYVGETNSPPEFRLYGHYLNARSDRPCVSSALTDWLLENEGNVETFRIAAAETREEARAIERTIIALCLRLNQRLFNRAGVPRDRRIPRREAAARRIASLEPGRGGRERLPWGTHTHTRSDRTAERERQ